MIAALFEIIGGSSEGFASAVTEVRPSFSALYMFSAMELDLPCAFIGLMLRSDSSIADEELWISLRFYIWDESTRLAMARELFFIIDLILR